MSLDGPGSGHPRQQAGYRALLQGAEAVWGTEVSAPRKNDQHTIALLCHDPADRRRLVRAVEAAGYRVIVPSPEETDPLVWSRADLVIVDEATAQQWKEVLLSTRTRDWEVPPSMVIALPRGKDAVRWLEAGFDDVIWLPPADTELIARLRILLQLRDRAEERGRQQVEIARTLLEHSPVGVYFFVEDRIIYVNRALAEWFGYRPEEVIGKMSPLDVVHPEDRSEVQERIRQRLAGEAESAHYVFRGVRKDGTVIYCEAFGHRVDYEGRPAIVGTLIDVTEWKQTEEMLRRSVSQLILLHQVGREIAATMDLEALIQQAVRLIQQAFGYHHVALFLLDQERNALVMRARAGQFVDLFPPDHQVPLGKGLVGWAAKHGERELANDVSKDPRYINFYPDRIPTRSELCVPIRIGNEVIGVLDTQSPDLNAFDESDVMVMATLADQIGVAIHNIRLYRAEQRERELAEALAETAAVVGGTLDLGQVLEGILNQVQRVVAGDAFNISLIEGDHARIVRARGYERVGKATEILDLSIPLHSLYGLSKMVQTGAPVVVPDTAAERRWVHKPGWEWIRSYVGAPIRVKGLTVGFLNVDGTRPGQFGPEDARRLQAFADQVGTAIENARLYQQLQKYAEDLEMRVQERTAQLAAQYARLEAILRSTTDGIVVADRQGNIHQANPVAQAWLERTLSIDDARRLREVIRDLAARAEERPEEVLELTGLDLEMRAAPIAGGEREELAVVAIHDVTRLRALDRMRSRFISNISHELRTPLATIKLYASLMRRQPAHWAEHLKPLEREVDRLVELVEDILEFSRIDAGRVALSLEKTSLHRLAQSAVERHRVMAQEKGITLEQRPPEEEVVVEVDPERMREVLDNLMTNAIRYTPSGGRVTVSVGRKEAEDRMWAVVTVADTGIGIPEEELPFIFDRFFRGETPRRMQIPGTGLGLAIVKELVEMHGGWVTVESKEGEGSTFTVWLPLAG
ncbi:MAG TPA: PAS domain S-box protein [Chloroflexi bacterium]|nr:PAS domain S-box protein [Chloroflexota bacterium]